MLACMSAEITTQAAEFPLRSVRARLPIVLAGMGSTPIIGGFLADHFGLISVFAFLAASVVAANLLCLTIPKTEHGA